MRDRCRRTTRRALWCIFSVALLLSFAGQAICQTSNRAATQQLDAWLRDAQTAIAQKEYARAMELLTMVQVANPSYRSSQVKSLMDAAVREAGKGGLPPTAYATKETAPVTVKVSQQDSLDILIREAEKVILDASNLLSKVRTQQLISDFDLVEPTTTMKASRDAFEKKQYTEAIRLANKTRYQIESLLQRKKTEEQPAPASRIGSTPVTLNLNNADLQQTLKLIYDLTGANIILSSGISGRVTMNVREIPLTQALNLICEANHLKFVEEQGVIKIMTEEEYLQRPSVVQAMTRRVFPILYGDGNSIVKALKETLRLDAIVYEPRSNSIIVDIADERLAQTVENVISTLDSPVSQVLIEAKIVEYSSSQDDIYGIDWLINSNLITVLGHKFTLTGPRFGVNPAFNPGVTTTLPSGFSFGVTGSTYNTLISMLATRGKVRLVQAPRIMCLNGTTASISVTQNYPYIIPTSSTITDPVTGTQTTTQSITVMEDSVGTDFIITPIIQKNRNVYLNLSISDSRLLEVRRLEAVAGNLSYMTEVPIIADRATDQNVVLFDGQTLVVGGMIQERKEYRESGVPLLRRIPFLGFLFKKPTHSATQGELILFLTPRVITTFQEGEEMSKPSREKAEEPVEPPGNIYKLF